MILMNKAGTVQINNWKCLKKLTEKESTGWGWGWGEILFYELVQEGAEELKASN